MASQMAQREQEQSQKESSVVAKDNSADAPLTPVQPETKDPIIEEKPANPPTNDESKKESPIVANDNLAVAPSASVQSETKDPVSKDEPASPPTNDGI